MRTRASPSSPKEASLRSKRRRYTSLELQPASTFSTTANTTTTPPRRSEAELEYKDPAVLQTLDSRGSPNTSVSFGQRGRRLVTVCLPPGVQQQQQANAQLQDKGHGVSCVRTSPHGSARLPSRLYLPLSRVCTDRAPHETILTSGTPSPVRILHPPTNPCSSLGAVGKDDRDPRIHSRYVDVVSDPQR